MSIVALHYNLNPHQLQCHDNKNKNVKRYIIVFIPSIT